MKVYFDNAATTKVRDEVVDEIIALGFEYFPMMLINLVFIL